MYSFVLAVSLLLQALPPPFPRDGATLVFENEQVALWDVVWEKGNTTPLHEHRHTALSVTIQPGQVRSIMRDGTSRIGELEKVGNVQFGGKGLVHREEGVSDTPRRVILLELKENAEPPSAIPEGVVPAWPREGADKVLDNELVVVWDYTYRDGVEVPLHFHDKDSVFVMLESGSVRIIPSDGEPRSLDIVVGRSGFSPRGGLHREERTAGEPRIIVIELKR